ncbi:Phosphoglucosamine mutase [Zostera marina]|uniref:Phosphoglucosamine mutase n=1 Tax=Zostera marina TaxID=29655 RepID=A0A0K9Q0L6_ZOSMR|nr:Phosphoglucosamine mutase [Zostera marina]
MGLGKSPSQDEQPEFGAAANGEADRNMIFGKRSNSMKKANICAEYNRTKKAK